MVDISQVYNITDDATEWNEQDVTRLNLDAKNDASDQSGALSKYALLRQLVSPGHGEVQTTEDEADPLGSTDSVVAVLRARGIDASSSVDRSKYLVSSIEFEPRQFLRDVHSEATYDNLTNSLDYLESSITQQSEALRTLVERDYDRFVKSKTALDSVLEQIKSTGFSADHEWGLQTTKNLIDDSNAKATVIMKPVIDNQAREERLKAALELIKANKYLFNLPSTILKHVKNNDHDSLVRDYRRGKDMRSNEIISADTPEIVIHNKKITDRIWGEVEVIVDEYKRDTWKVLSTTSAEQNYMQVIAKLLELGVEDNPILEWIECQIRYFDDLFTDQFEKLKLTARIMSTNLAGLPSATNSLFILPHNDGDNDEITLSDAPDIVEMWIALRLLLGDISNGIERCCLFWECCAGFLSGEKQRGLPTGYQGESEVHLSFSDTQIEEIKKSGREMVERFADAIRDFFSAPSPTQGSFSGSSAREGHSEKDKQGQDSFLFLPPNTNALSAVHYLSEVLNTLVSSFSTLSKASMSARSSESLTNVLALVRDRCVQAVCKSWANDSEKFALLEDWVTDSTGSQTHLPEHYEKYLMQLLKGVKSVLMFSSHEDSRDRLVVPKPSSRLMKVVSSTLQDSAIFLLDSLMGLLTTLGDPSRASYVEKSLPSTASDELTPQEKNNESKILLLLSNLSLLRNKIMPRVYHSYEKTLGLRTHEANMALRDKMDEMDTTLFDVYTRKKRTVLSSVIRHGILERGFDWNTSSSPKAISNYVYDSLLMLVVVHARVSDVSPVLVERVIGVLYEHILKTILSRLREVETFSDQGMLQAAADVEFLRTVMSNFKTPEAQNTTQLIYKTLRSSTTKLTSWDSKQGPKAFVRDVVNAATEKSRVSMMAFAIYDYQ
uniref:Exocyst complex component SEC5 n=1 Tax=Blastobotrys adeninivorans TaxID=409370 RepID=A0A060T388_BLAAD